jgi:hypothetical protein
MIGPDHLNQPKIKKDSLIVPTLFLTIMNSQSRKNKVSIQGYFVASSLVFMNAFEDISTVTLCYKLLHQNLDTVKRSVTPELSSQIFISMLGIYNETLQNLVQPTVLKPTDATPNKDLLLWYIKNNNEQADIFLKLKQVSRESFGEYITKKIGSVCDLAICGGWIMGSGKDIASIKKVSKYFTMLYKLAKDFWSIGDDLKNITSDISDNYVINYGLQESYELFMYNKQKFIEETMTLDIYTTTIKEIIDYIEFKVDEIIEETSPDLKSNLSNV